MINISTKYNFRDFTIQDYKGKKFGLCDNQPFDSEKSLTQASEVLDLFIKLEWKKDFVRAISDKKIYPEEINSQKDRIKWNSPNIFVDMGCIF